MSELSLRNAIPHDALRCYEIERAAFEGDEAATREKIALRIERYPEGFLVLELHGQLVGFINSGCAHQVQMADEAFKELVGHDPLAPNAVILSLAVDPALQGNGYASVLMRAFVERMRHMGKRTIHLICKPHHVGLYEHFGYGYVRPSESQHGGMSWHEMLMEL